MRLRCFDCSAIAGNTTKVDILPLTTKRGEPPGSISSDHRGRSRAVQPFKGQKAEMVMWTRAYLETERLREGKWPGDLQGETHYLFDK